MFQNDLDVDMLQNEITSCFRNWFIVWSLILNSFNGLCFKWVYVVKLTFNGLHFRWGSMFELDFCGLCFVWVSVVYVSVDYRYE
jgi:hypothetical protein